SKKNESIHYKPIKDTLCFSYRLIDEIRAIEGLKDVARLVRDYTYFLLCRIFNVRPLIKYPTGVFSAEWLASTFNMDVVVLIRHPAAFAGTLKNLNWTYSFSELLEQPLLMRDHSYPFEEEIREYAKRKHDIIDQATLLWRLIYHMALKYRRSHKDWIFVRHEDLSRDPLSGFRNIFERLDLQFSERVKNIVRKHSNRANSADPSDQASIRRNSKLNIYNWKNRLTRSEIERIRADVKDISDFFYSDEDW
ncbi:unnamed protein product, partial [marine sediment metagenome]